MTMILWFGMLITRSRVHLLTADIEVLSCSKYRKLTTWQGRIANWF